MATKKTPKTNAQRHAAKDPLGMMAGLQAIQQTGRARTPAGKANAKKALTNIAKDAPRLAKAVAAIVQDGAPPARPNVKVAILDLFYSNLDLKMTTLETVLALQHHYAGMNESSIRVWLTDLRKDGTLMKVGQEEGKDVLMAGVPGDLALRGSTSAFALKHTALKTKPKAAPVRMSVQPLPTGRALPPAIKSAISGVNLAMARLTAEISKLEERS